MLEFWDPMRIFLLYRLESPIDWNRISLKRLGDSIYANAPKCCYPMWIFFERLKRLTNQCNLALKI